VLQAARKAGPDGGVPAALHDTLASNVHLRLAEAFHSMKNRASAEAHYEKSLYLMQKSPNANSRQTSEIKSALSFLHVGSGPELRCSSRPKAPWDVKDAPSVKDVTFLAKVKILLAEKKYDLVESKLKLSLKTQSRPYQSSEAAVSLNLLGDMYGSQHNFAKAAKQFRQALHAAITCCGAGSQEAKKAFEGLRDIQTELPTQDQRVASAAIQRYLDVANKLASPADDSQTASDPQLSA
jgi:tetratricopeptide (TPR) repeat protein